MTRTTSRELANRIQNIKDALDLKDDKISDLLIEARYNDEKNIEDILRKEGEMMAQEEFIYTLENEFLKTQTLQKIREYKEYSSDEWDFLSNQEKNIIQNTIKILKKTSLEYSLKRAELMILRKEVIDFVTTKLKNIDSSKKPTDIINIIIDNYTYLDTLKNLGYNKEKDGYLRKYYLDEDLMFKLKE